MPPVSWPPSSCLDWLITPRNNRSARGRPRFRSSSLLGTLLAHIITSGTRKIFAGGLFARTPPSPGRPSPAAAPVNRHPGNRPPHCLVFRIRNRLPVHRLVVGGVGTHSVVLREPVPPISPTSSSVSSTKRSAAGFRLHARNNQLRRCQNGPDDRRLRKDRAALFQPIRPICASGGGRSSSST